jgi:Domain of unknown function (DUF4939)
MTCRRPFQFSAPGNKLTPEPSPKPKPKPETLTSGDSDFESATESPASEPTRNFIELIEGGPQIGFEEHDPLVKSSYFTEPRPNPRYSPIENLFTTIQKHNQPITLHTIMAQPVNRTKELNLNKPEAFNGNRDGFKEFLQNVEVYMDVNHETYNNDLRKIVFVLSFMTTESAATWKAQFIKEAYAKPAPANPNARLGTYTQFRKDLMEAFSMFNSVGDALDELQSLRKKKKQID